MVTVTGFTCKSTNAPVAFEHSGRSAGLFTRYLTLRGERAYRLSFSCGTCAFLFERLGTFGKDPSGVPELDATFRRGVTSIDSSLLERIAPIIPAGNYTAILRQIVPQLVSPYSADDYFTREQVSLWGVEPGTGLPQYPATEYYRAPTRGIGDCAAFFEFVAPMVPKNWLDEEAVEGYSRVLLDGNTPTALAIGVLDVKSPAMWKGDPVVTKHYCLAHFLLDGHHKLHAAAMLQKPISLLSCIARDECIASSAQVDEAVSLLAGSQ